MIEWAISSLRALGTQGNVLEVTTFTNNAFRETRLVQITPAYDCLIDITTKSDLELECKSLASNNVAYIRVLAALVPDEQDWLSRTKPQEFYDDFKKEIEAAADFIRINRPEGQLTPKERNAVIRQSKHDLAAKKKRGGKKNESFSLKYNQLLTYSRLFKIRKKRSPSKCEFEANWQHTNSR